MSQGVLCQKIRFLGQKLWPVACGQTDKQTNKHEFNNWEPYQGFILSSFCLWSDMSGSIILGVVLVSFYCFIWKTCIPGMSSTYTLPPHKFNCTKWTTWPGLIGSSMRYFESYAKSLVQAIICINKHNTELRGTAPGANIQKRMFFMSNNMTFGPLGHVLALLKGPPNKYF